MRDEMNLMDSSAGAASRGARAMVFVTLLCAGASLCRADQAAAKNPPPDPFIRGLAAVPASISAGESVILTWDVENGSILAFDQMIGNVTGMRALKVTLDETTTYTLTALNGSIRALRPVTVTVAASGTVAMPTIEPPVGAYAGLDAVTIEDSTEGAVIHYTLNGTDPTEHSLVYSGAIHLTADTTVKAMASKPGLVSSPIASTVFTIHPDSGPAPIRSQGFPSGTLAPGTKEVTMRLATDRAAICKYDSKPSSGYSEKARAVWFSGARPFEQTGGTVHSQKLSNLSDDLTYTFYVRCQSASDRNQDDYLVRFATPKTVLPVPDLSRLPATVPVHGTLKAGYPSGYPNNIFIWTVARGTVPVTTPPEFFKQHNPPATHAAIATRTATPELRIGNWMLRAGTYTVTLQATDGIHLSKAADKTFQLVDRKPSRKDAAPGP